MDSLDFRLINEFQRDFPLESQPFAELAYRLCTDEETVLAVLQRLRQIMAKLRIRRNQRGVLINPLIIHDYASSFEWG